MKIGKKQNERLFSEFMERYKNRKFPDKIMQILEKFPEKRINLKSVDLDKNVKGIDTVKLIIKAFGRPAFLVQNNKFDPSTSETWKDVLAPYSDDLSEKIQSVGIIKIKNHRNSNYAGTGFLIDNSIIITNQHVANILFQSTGNGYTWKTNSGGKELRASIDFVKEYKIHREMEMDIKGALFIEQKAKPDIAFLEINMTNNIKPLKISTSTSYEDDVVATIGYPSKPKTTSYDSQKILDLIFENIYDVKRLSPGEITKTETQDIKHNCTTTAGNSGSAILDIETGEVVALHYAGGIESNSAISSNIIQYYLKKIVKN